MQVALRPEIRAQPDVRIDRRIDQHCARVVLLGKVGGIEAPERGAEEAGARIRRQLFDLADGVDGKRRQRRTGVLRRQAALGQVPLRELRLMRLRRGIEAVQVDDQAAASLPPCPRRFSSLSWMPPKPPLDMTRTWSPAFASAATAPISRSRSSSQRARVPSAANTAPASQPRPEL